MVKNLTAKHFDVSTSAEIFDILDYVINSAACPDTYGVQGTTMLRVSEPPPRILLNIFGQKVEIIMV